MERWLWTLGVLVGGTAVAAEEPPCRQAGTLRQALTCVQEHEASYRSAAQSEEVGEQLRESAFRLVNPEFELDYADGKNFGDVDRSASAALLFTFELGGKRAARAKLLGGEGRTLSADAFDQQIEALTDLGGALLRVSQYDAEKAVLAESVEAFRRVIRLYRSRGNLGPEQRVSLHAFELALISYERKLIEIDASLVRYRKRVEKLFGANAKGVPFELAGLEVDLKTMRERIEEWLPRTPEMLRAEADQERADGEAELAQADVWPDLRIGPSVTQVTDGPTQYYTYGFKASFPLPILSWNGSARQARERTAIRTAAHTAWTKIDARSKYESLLSEMERLKALLLGVPTAEGIRSRHSATESLYQRGMISGSLMIETHRALVEHYESLHALQSDYLEGALKLKHLQGHL